MRGLLVFGLILFAVSLTFANDISKIKSEHLAQASKYDESARAQQSIIDEHVKMKHDFHKKYWINEKLSPKLKIKEMETHCDKIIQAAKTQKSNLEMMAEIHKFMAKELEKK